MTLTEGERVTDGRRSGVVDQILVTSQRGLPGAKCVDVFVRLDDGPVIPANPNDLWPETEARDGRP